MNVAMVTTWGQPCGIATYSEGLVSGLLNAGARVVPMAPSDQAACTRQTDVQAVLMSWSRGSDLSSLRLDGFDVVHVQHENGLHPVSRSLLSGLRRIRKSACVVVTLHTCHHANWKWAGFIEELKSSCDLIIVHTNESAAAVIAAPGAGADVAIIPHGTPTIEATDRESAVRDVAGLFNIPSHYLSNDLVIGSSLGFQGPNKNSIASVRAFSLACSSGRMRDAIFCIAGDFGDENYFMAPLMSVIRETGYDARMFVRPGFVSHANKCKILSGSDFGVLNTNTWTLSSSGQAHEFMSAGVPLAVANRPIYSDAVRGGAIPFDVQSVLHEEPTLSMIDAISALGSSSSLRETVRGEHLAFAAATWWNEIAKQHVLFYEKSRKVKSAGR